MSARAATRLVMLIRALVICCGIAFRAHAAPADLVVSGTNRCPEIILDPFPPPVFAVEWGTRWSELGNEAGQGFGVIAPGGGGRVLAIEETPPFAFRLFELHADGTRQLLYQNADYLGVGLVADAEGRIFVLGTNPVRARVFALSETGSEIGGWNLAPVYDEPQFIELAMDQCTLYYSDGSTSRRFDVCSGSPLSPLPDTIGGDVHVLPNGDLLLRGPQRLRRYRADGILLRTYPLGMTPDVIALTGTGTTAVVGSSCDWVRFADVDLNTGAVTMRTESTQAVRGWLVAIVSSRSWTAALGSRAAAITTDVPLLGVWGAALLALLLGFAALRQFR